MQLHIGTALVLVSSFLLAACSAETQAPPAQDPAPAAEPAAEEPAAPAAGETGEPAEKQPEEPKGRTFAPAVEGDPMGVVIYQLDNGLTVMLSENHEEPRFQAYITARTGSGKDPADSTGLAHYLEHMLFKGTTKLGTMDWEKEKPHLDAINELYDKLFTTTDPEQRKAIFAEIDKHNVAASEHSVPNEFDQIYDAWGAQRLNAFTSTDQTSYVVNLPSNRLESWAALERHRFDDPVFRLFQTELEAVYEEKNRAMDNKDRVMYRTLSRALFPQHPYGTQTTLGSVEHLKNPSLNQMYEYYEKWYVPGNMVIALSGDFDTEHAVKVIEKHFGDWEAKDVPPDPEFPTPKPKGVERHEVTYDAEDQVAVGWVTVPVAHPDRDALVLCDMMMDNQNTGLINVNIMQAQAARAAGSYPRFMPQAGAQVLHGIPKPGQTLEDVEALLLEQMQKLKAGEFSAEDLAGVMTDFEMSQKRELEDNNTRARKMTSAYIDAVDWEHKVRELDRLRAITKEDVVAAANKYFGDDYVVVYRRAGKSDIPKMDKPAFTVVKLGEGKHSPMFNEKQTEEVDPLEPKFVEKGEDYTVTELKSGSLYYTRNPVNDLFQLSFRIPIGTDHDPRLNLAFGLLDLGGAGDLDPVAYKRKLYSLGSSISGGAGQQESGVTVTGLEANLEETLALLDAHFSTPTGVGQEDLAKLVQRSKGRRQFQKREARAINGALGNYATRGKESPYLKAPTNEELDAYVADELLAAVKDVWKYRQKISYVGQRPADEVGKLLDARYAGVEKLEAGHPHKPIAYVKPGKNRVLLVDKTTAQSLITMVAADGLFDRTSVPMQRAYNEYMSGSMGAVVFQEIRESRALAYTCWTNYRAASRADEENLMIGSLGTQVDKTTDAIEVLLEIVRKIPAEATRFNQTKTAIDQQYRTRRIGFRRIPGVVQTWEEQGLDGDPRNYNWTTIGKMELADLEKFASRFADMHFTIAIVGDKSRIDLEKLATFGEVIEMTPDELFAW